MGYLFFPVALLILRGDAADILVKSSLGENLLCPQKEKYSCDSETFLAILAMDSQTKMDRLETKSLIDLHFQLLNENHKI